MDTIQTKGIKMNLEQYTQEDVKIEEVEVVPSYEMVEDGSLQEAEFEYNMHVGNAKVFEEKAQQLETLVELDEVLVESDLTAEAVSASVKVSDIVMGELRTLLAEPLTQESITIDPKAALTMTVSDKKAIIKKAKDLAIKAWTMAIAALRKWSVQAVKYFGNVEKAVKEFKAKLNESEDFKLEGVDDAKAESIRSDINVFETLNTRGFEVVKGSKLYKAGDKIDKVIESIGKDFGYTYPEAVVQAAKDGASVSVTALGYNSKGLAIAIAVAHKSGDSEVETKLYYDSITALKPKEYVLDGTTKSDVSEILAQSEVYVMTLDKTIKEAFKTVDTREKAFKDAAAEVDKKPEDSLTVAQYKLAKAAYTSSPKIAQAVAMGHYFTGKRLFKIAMDLYNARSKKEESK